MFGTPTVFMIWFFIMMMFDRMVIVWGSGFLLSFGVLFVLLPVERPILDVPTGTEEEDDLYTFNCCTQPILRCRHTILHLQQQQQDRSRRIGQTPNSSSVFRQLYISLYNLYDLCVFSNFITY